MFRLDAVLPHVHRHPIGAVLCALFLTAGCADPLPSGPTADAIGLAEFPVGDGVLNPPPDSVIDDVADGGPDALDDDVSDVPSSELPDVLLTDEGGPEVGSEVGLDATPDVAPELEVDVGVEVTSDTGPDLLLDIGPDLSPDVSGDEGLDAFGGTPLNAPGLSVPPDDAGDLCDPPGSSGACGFLEVCRPKYAESGQCESCEQCGNLGASCAASNQCDILFTCFQGKCTNICPLGTYACGPIPDCVDIGHPTHGVCKP